MPWLLRALNRTLKFVIVSTGLLILVVQIEAGNAAAFEEQTSDITADCALALEDYPPAIALYRSFLRSHPDDSLAHYHLGFAYGMSGRSSQERSEYLKAARLGLREWDLFLDLGLSYFEQRDYENAIHAFERSVTLGSHHPEARFNLAMAYEQAGRLPDAMREIIASLRMAPSDLDMRNTKAIICAELGDLKCAHDEWALLRQVAPTYAPARTNLAILMAQLRRCPLQLPTRLRYLHWSHRKVGQKFSPCRIDSLRGRGMQFFRANTH
jgi:Flp pilus assembly protein TadD